MNAKVQKDGTKVISKFARVFGLDAGEKGRLFCAPFVYSTIIAVIAVTAGLIVPASAGFDDVVADRLPEPNTAAADPHYFLSTPFELASSAHLKQSVFGFAGRTNSGNLGSTFAYGIGNPGTIFFDNYIVGGAYQRDFIQFNNGLLIGAEVGIADRFGTYEICCDTVSVQTGSHIQQNSGAEYRFVTKASRCLICCEFHLGLCLD